MKVEIDETLFKAIPGLCVGIIAARAVDNRELNMEAEAFRRRCCTETNLLLKINPHMADKDLAAYREAQEKLGITGVPTFLDDTFKEYKKDLGLDEEEQEKLKDDIHILQAPKKASLDELAASDVLPRINPVMDIVRSGMLKFHVDIHPYAVEDENLPLVVKKTGSDVLVTLGNDVLTKGWFGKSGVADGVYDMLFLLTGFRENRQKVASARNELARRIKSAFDRSVEVGWIEKAPYEFTTTI